MWQAFLPWLAAAVGVLPFLLLSAYSYPSADDWHLAADTMEKGFLQSNVDYYTRTTGRFFSSAFLFMNPMLLSFGAFKCYSLSLVAGLVLCTRWAVGAWFPAASNTWKWTAALTLVVAFLWGMAAPVQGFYWGTGSAGYTQSALFTLAIAGLFGRRSLNPAWRPHPAVLVLASLLAVATTGCTEVAMALLLLHVAAWNAVYFWINRRISRPLAILLLATILGAVMVVLSPGNALRSEYYSNGVKHVLPAAVALAVKLGIKQVLLWLVFVPFALLSFVAVVAWPEHAPVSRQRCWELIAAALVLMACTVFGAYFLGTWSMGHCIPMRGVNLVLFFFIIDWLALLAGLIALLRTAAVELPRPGLFLSFGLVCILLVSFASSPNNVKTAWRDLLSGDAARYSAELTKRHELLRSTREQDVLVPPLKSRPKTLFFNDLTPDPLNWRNTGCARFFRKRSVAITTSSSQP
ncbi:DUF6056 family protein [Prosthecobacter vanneervenii]